MKYEYLLYTWGVFYNKEHQEKHNQIEGCHYFDTKEERDEYLLRLRKIEIELNARCLMSTKSEGYCVRDLVTMHRVVKWKGKEYYSKLVAHPNYLYSSAKSYMKNAWFPGFNDYPLGEEFDYQKNKVEIVQEWVTGSFDIKEPINF